MPALWIPDSARPDPPTPGRLCTVCGEEFARDRPRQFRHHIQQCAKRNLPEIQQAVEDRRDPFTEVQDKEKYRWVREKAVEHGPDKANRMLRGKPKT